MFSRRQKFVRLICVVHDVSVTVLALLSAHLLRSEVVPLLFPGRAPLYPIREYLPFIAASMIMFPALALVLGTCDGRSAERGQAFKDALMISTLGSVAIAAFLYTFRAEYVSRSYVVLFALCECVFLFGGRSWLWPGSRRLQPRSHRQRRFLIAGTGDSGRELATRLRQDLTAENFVIGFIATQDAIAGESLDGVPVFSPGHASEILTRDIVDEVDFAVNKDELADMEMFVIRCQEQGIQVRLCLDFLPRTVSRVYLEHLQEIPLLTLSSTPDDEWLLFVKRVFDVVVASASLALVLPVMACIAVFVRVTSRGPILYRQTRCGLGGRQFTLYKFRSMVQGADEMRDGLDQHNELDGPAFKMSEDPRCTPIGRWLRKWSLDELPQLWNVIRGDMSLVGPRPPIPAEVAQYESWHRRRLRMRPGLTCLWVVQGRNQVKFERWMQLDMDYIDNWSLWLDLKILVRSIPVVLSGRGAC
jgi:exopolysaccharide biosynthesis polyprenyl glycosylphosphotransferase